MGREQAGGPDLSFEGQLSQREEIMPGVFAVDLVPANQTSLPVYFNLGWNSQISDYETSLRLAFESGRRVLSAELPDEPEEQKAQHILHLFDAKKIRKTHLIAHSVGSISAALAAIKDSELFEKATFINPAGLIPGDTPEDLIRRYKSLLEQFRGFARAPEIGSIQRIKAMARTITSFDMNDALKRIAGLGINILTVQAEDDTLFPMGRTNIDEPIRKIIVPGGHYSVDQGMLLALGST